MHALGRAGTRVLAVAPLTLALLLGRPLGVGVSEFRKQTNSPIAAAARPAAATLWRRPSQGGGVAPAHRRAAAGTAAAQGATIMYTAVEFEVYGLVQGVFFRAYTTDKARQLGLVGYCQNMHKGTVKGEVQGPKQAVEEMKGWLSTTGSPHSVIERCDFSNERELEVLEYSNFSTRRR